MKSFQDEINEAALKTYKQGVRSSNTIRGCMYDGDDGLRCAVGHMMTDAELAEFGKFYGGALDLHESGWRPDLTPEQVNILIKLQESHDKADDSDYKASLLKNLDHYGLKEIAEYIENEMDA